MAINHPWGPWFILPLLFWDFAYLLTQSSFDALAFYHEAMAEMLELIR